MKKIILLSAITVSLFISSASARTMLDDASEVLGRTTRSVGSVISSVIETVSELLGLHNQKVAATQRHSISPAEMFQNVKLNEVPYAEEDSSLVLASVYPELNRTDAPSSAQKLSQSKGLSILKELKKQEEREDLTASEYTVLVAEVSQNTSSSVPFTSSGKTESAIINWDGVTFDQNPNAETDALLARMSSTHTRNPNSSLLFKAGK